MAKIAQAFCRVRSKQLTDRIHRLFRLLKVAILLHNHRARVVAIEVLALLLVDTVLILGLLCCVLLWRVVPAARCLALLRLILVAGLELLLAELATKFADFPSLAAVVLGLALCQLTLNLGLRSRWLRLVVSTGVCLCGLLFEDIAHGWPVGVYLGLVRVVAEIFDAELGWLDCADRLHSQRLGEIGAQIVSDAHR